MHATETISESATRALVPNYFHQRDKRPRQTNTERRPYVSKPSRVDSSNRARMCCSYCNKDNHLVSNCFSRKHVLEKNVGFVQNKTEDPFRNVNKNGRKENRYISDATIAGTKNCDRSNRVKIYRDTEASQMLIAIKTL